MTVSNCLSVFVASLLPHAEALAVDCAALVSDPADSEALNRALRSVQNLTGTISLALAVRGDTTPPAMALFAHEVRNPLSAVSNTLQLLAKLPRQTFAKTALDSVLHMHRVIKGELVTDIVTLSSLCQLAAESFVGVTTEKSILLELDVAQDLPLCQMHSVQIRQIVLNLLGNAMKFTPVGGVVVLKATRAEAGVTISVKDSGVGMSEELRERLFQPYVQAAETASLGCGLGLSITYGLVHELGGSIEVGSQLGVGSIFLVELPLSAVQLSVPALPVNDCRPSDNSAPSVLLVDDDDLIRETFGWCMEDLGIVCVPASNCSEALERASERSFDLILVDGLYGAAAKLIPELRAIASGKGYRPGIIGFSGRDSIDVELDGVLPKPATAVQVLPFLERFRVDKARSAAA